MSEHDDESDETASAIASERPPPGCRLVVVDGAAAGVTRVLAPGRHVVGRAATADLRIDDHQLSRFHFEILVDSESIAVADLGSSNGIWVNGARVTHAQVRPGATIVAGQLRFVIMPAEVDDELPALDRLGGLVGGSVPMRRVYRQLLRLRASDATVLICGESGTGKEVCATALHEMSTRCNAPFVVCDLSTLGTQTMESELFGHVRGAFTGAVADMPGLLRGAAGGTVLLDEIGELPRDAQSKLLRLVERKEIRAVGSDLPSKLDIRLIAATLRPLAEMVKAGTFRNDLLHRLSVITIALPPLRERLEDVGMLATHLLRGLAPGVSWTLTDDAEALLAAYPWPGNVRELRNVLQRVVAQADPPVIDVQALVRCGELEIAVERGPVSFHDAKELIMDRWEKVYLHQLLERTGGNITRAADTAGMARAHLYRLLKKHQIEVG